MPDSRLQEIFKAARERGPAWREALDGSLARMEKLGMTEMPALLRKA